MERSIIWRRICSGKPARELDCGRDYSCFTFSSLSSLAGSRIDLANELARTEDKHM